MGTVHGLPLSLRDACAAFGAPVGTSLGDLVRGGPWVPNIPANEGVPVYRPIRLGQLVGATSFVPMSLYVPSAVFASSTSTDPSCTTHPVTAVASDGNPSKAYSWSFVSGSPAVRCGAVSSATTTFYQVGSGNIDQTYTAVWRCTVSDGTSVLYGDCEVTIDRIGIL